MNNFKDPISKLIYNYNVGTYDNFFEYMKNTK